MFNLQGSELVIILLLALVVLGPEKLPDAMRKMGQFYAELKKMSSGFQSEFKSAVDEPLSELRNTANTLRDSADFTKFQAGEREEKPKSAEMVAAPDPEAVPTDDVPFVTDAAAAAATGAGVAGLADSDTSDNGIVESDVFESELTDPEPTPSTESAPIPPPPMPFSSSQQLSTSLPPTQPTPPPDPDPVAAPESDPGDTDGAGEEHSE